MHKLTLINKSKARYLINTGGGSEFHLNPGQTIETDVLEDSVFYKYDEIQLNIPPQKPKITEHKGYQKPRESKTYLVLEVENLDPSVPTQIIKFSNNEKLRLFYGMKHWVRFDKFKYAEAPEIQYKKIIFKPPVQRKRYTRGMTFSDRVKQIEFIKRDDKKLQEIDDIKSAKRKQELGMK